MGLIKDIIDANSIEQKRRLANRLPIDMEDKNSLINNKGNGGESEDNNQNIIYIDIQHPIGSTQDYWIVRNLPYALYIKFYDEDGNICIGFPYWVGNSVGNNIIAIAIDLSAKISPDGKEFISVEEFITTDVLTNFPRLTKEEFYNLEV